MSAVYTTDFTKNAIDLKSRLDEFFQIPLREDALAIIGKMKKLNTDLNKTALGDQDVELLEILGNDDKYIQDHSQIQLDGTKKPISLFADKLGDKYSFDDTKRNAEVIEGYESYVKKLKSINELDTLFLDKLNAVYSKYKSSSDYMERLVRRLLKYNFNYKDVDLKGETTRVLILKQVLKQFDGFKDIPAFNARDLMSVIKKEYKGDYDKVDDKIFDKLKNQDSKFGDSAITEGFIDALSKMQGVIKYKSPYIVMTSELCENICSIIRDEELTDKAKSGSAVHLAECFNQSFEKVDLSWFKLPGEINISEKYNDLLCMITKEEKLSKKAVNGTANTIAECIKGRIPFGSSIFKEFSDIKMTENLCADFYKIKGKTQNEADERSKASKNGTAETLSECYSVSAAERKITSINSFVMYLYKKYYDDFELKVSADFEKSENGQLKKRYNNATKKGGDLYEQNRKKLNFNNYEILEMVDDLANARFSSHGKTREIMYVFAIAFNMTACGYNESSFMAYDERNFDPRKITDIQKNLFYDYYADNIINNLPKISGMSEDIDGSDVMVDGYGINYKNFAEIAFLWCLNQEDKTAKEKLKMAYEIISYCKKNGKTAEELRESQTANDGLLTEHYRDNYLVAQLKTIDDVKKYLIERYVCKSNSGITQLNNDAATARVICDDIINNKIRIHYRKIVSSLFDYSNVEIQKLSLLTDILLHEHGKMFDYFKKKHYLINNQCNKCTKCIDASFPDCSCYDCSCEDKFRDYLSGLEDRDEYNFEKAVIEELEKNITDSPESFNKSFYALSQKCSQNQKGIKKILEVTEKRIKLSLDVIDKTINNPETGIYNYKISRSMIISLCYVDYILLNWHERLFTHYEYIHSFSDFYKGFCEGRVFQNKKGKGKNARSETIPFLGINYYLEKSGYQEINSKNLFDICIIFMAYRDNYKQFFEYEGDILVSDYMNKKHKYSEKENNNK